MNEIFILVYDIHMCVYMNECEYLCVFGSI